MKSRTFPAIRRLALLWIAAFLMVCLHGCADFTGEQSPKPCLENPLCPPCEGPFDPLWHGNDWRPGDSAGNTGVEAVYPREGAPGFVIEVRLNAVDEETGDHGDRIGEVLLDMAYVPRLRSEVPIDLSDSTLFARIDLPPELMGDSGEPIGIQPFVRDADLKSSCYKAWQGVAAPGVHEFALQPGTECPEFDAAQVRLLGIRLSTTETSATGFEGDLVLEALRIDPPVELPPGPGLPPVSPRPALVGKRVDLDGAGLFADGARQFVVCGNSRLVSYGQNFGVTGWYPGGNGVSRHTGFLRCELGEYARAGVQVIRVGLVTDGRALMDEDGHIVGYDERYEQDVLALLSMAADAGVAVELILVSYLIGGAGEEVNGVWLRGRPGVLTDPELRAEFTGEFLEPLLAEIGDHPALFGFDIINEPEWLVSEAYGGAYEYVSDDDPAKAEAPIPLEALRAFASECIEVIRQHAPQKPITMGLSASHLSLSRNIATDYAAPHYYDAMGPFDELAADFAPPWILEEYPTYTGPSQITYYLTKAHLAGGCGACLWNLTPGIDLQTYPPEKRNTVLEALADWHEP